MSQSRRVTTNAERDSSAAPEVLCHVTATSDERRATSDKWKRDVGSGTWKMATIRE